MVVIIIVTKLIVIGVHQVITSSLVAFRPTLLPYKPLLGFIVLIALFLIDLVLATQVSSSHFHFITFTFNSRVESI